tara:strand:- start:35 stop:166 length:132 start_codon:yes stop_codon:yes gene_type:complete
VEKVVVIAGVVDEVELMRTSVEEAVEDKIGLEAFHLCQLRRLV